MKPTASPFISRVLLASLLLLLPGCLVARVNLNDPIDPAAVSGLQPGMTSADVVAALGAPTEVIQLGLRSAYRFDHQRKKRAGIFILILGFFNEDTREDRVWAFFDEEGILTHLGSTFDADETVYALPWSDIHE